MSTTTLADPRANPQSELEKEKAKAEYLDANDIAHAESWERALGAADIALTELRATWPQRADMMTRGEAELYAHALQLATDLWADLDSLGCEAYSSDHGSARFQ